MSLDDIDPNEEVANGDGKTVTRAELAAAVYRVTQLNRRSALKFVGETLDEITSCLVQGEDVMLTGFGRFEVRLKGERVGPPPSRPAARSSSARRRSCGSRWRAACQTARASGCSGRDAQCRPAVRRSVGDIGRRILRGAKSRRPGLFR